MPLLTNYVKDTKIFFYPLRFILDASATTSSKKEGEWSL
jgi:hypothetical protein